MAKKIVAIAIMAVMALGVFGFTGCGNDKYTIYEDGYFQYIIVGENSRFPKRGEVGVVAIVGFTESGKEQEVIDLPRVIDGKPVAMMGYRDEGFYHNNSHHVSSEKLRKMYVHDNIKSMEYFEGNNLDIMLCAADKNVHGLFRDDSSFLYLYLEFFEIRYNDYLLNQAKYPNEALATPEQSGFRFANVVFLNSYSTEINGGYYMFDNIESGEKVTKPPNPERTGYEFAGWFTELSCVNAWDFESSKEIISGTEFRLYAGWRAI